MAGDDSPLTRSSSQIARESDQRATENDLAKRHHEAWFNKFINDISKLEDDLTNYAAWMYVIRDVCKKQSCLTALTENPILTDKLAINNSKNVNLLITHSISEYIRHFLIKKGVFDTYTSIQTYRPKNNEQRVYILKDISKVDSSNPKAYVQAFRVIKS